MTAPRSITIRRAMPEDASAIERLAQLEGVRPPVGDILVADIDGDLWAAVELSAGAVVADPFRPSGEVAELLRLRVDRMCGDRQRRGLRGLLARGRAIPCQP